MKTTRLPTASTVTYGWIEADNRRVHELWVHIDECVIEANDSVIWLEGDVLEEAKKYSEVPHDVEPNWFVGSIDDDGKVNSISSEPEPEAVLQPLARFIQEELDRKLTYLRAMGKPRDIPLKTVYVPGRSSGFYFRAEDYRDATLINPALPDGFESAGKQASVRKVDPWPMRLTYFHWLDQPYILSRLGRDDQEVFDVFCLEEIPGRRGYWTNWWGSTGKLEEALVIAKEKHAGASVGWRSTL